MQFNGSIKCSYIAPFKMLKVFEIVFEVKYTSKNVRHGDTGTKIKNNQKYNNKTTNIKQ